MSGRKKAEKRNAAPARTDLGNARMFAQLWKDDLRFDHARGRWLVWRGHWWAEDTDGEVQRRAKQIGRLRLRTAANLPDVEERRKEITWALNSESCPRIEAIIKLAQSEPELSDSGTGWDADPMLFAVANGVIDLRTGRLRDGLPEDKITLHSNVVFDPEARCPRWEKFLNEIFEDDQKLISFVKRAIGYCLTGDTSEQVLFLLFGTGANGKSVLLDVLRVLMGDYYYNLPFSTFDLQARSGIPNDVAAIAGRRLVTANETGEATRLNEARIKSLTGCDTITARLLYKEPFTFKPVAKFMLAFNHKPSVADDSHGFWRRIRLILFKRLFDEQTADKHLPEKLLAELPGILNWAIEGCLEWQQQGLGVPEIVKKESEAYRHEMDTFSEFLDDCCVRDPIATVSPSALRMEYEEWCKGHGERPLNSRDLKARLESRGFTQERLGKNRDRFWKGICRRADAEGQGIINLDEDESEADKRTTADGYFNISVDNSLMRENPEDPVRSCPPVRHFDGNYPESAVLPEEDGEEEMEWSN